MPLDKIIFIVGPTAVGKTEAACLLAQDLKTDIISCDAMQVYKEISILTAKPSRSILKKIKHHMVDIISIKDDFNVSFFYQRTQKIIACLCRKGKIPVVVGGSGLYMTILLDGIFEDNAGDRLSTRKKIQGLIKEKGFCWAYEKVKEVDPIAAQKIHPNDSRRIIRTLEVFETYGKPISQMHLDRHGLWGKYDIRIFALSSPREMLYERINQRVEEMFRLGAIDEVRRLLSKKMSRTALGIIGVKEIMEFLDGKITDYQAKELIKRNTRRFAKRQMTWFRKDHRLQWLEVASERQLLEAVQKIILSLDR